MPTNGMSAREGCSESGMLRQIQQGGHPEDHHVHDLGQGCICTISRRAEEHRNRGLGPEEAGIPVPHVRHTYPSCVQP
jgi:hypothetical protein